MSEIQRRYVQKRKIELRNRPDGATPRIVGYAAVFYRANDPSTEFEMLPAENGWPRVVERMMPGAFDAAVKSDDVRALFNHDPNQVLGRTGAGTLRLSVDQTGLRYEIDPPDTQAARDLVEMLRRGDVSGSSFGFLPRSGATRQIKGENGAPDQVVFERNDVQLFDVGPVTFPAYSGASSGVRAADLANVRAEVEQYRGRARADRDALEILLWLAENDTE